VGSVKSEVGSRKSEVGSPKWVSGGKTFKRLTIGRLGNVRGIINVECEM
jgi:hypothetical protein